MDQTASAEVPRPSVTAPGSGSGASGFLGKDYGNDFDPTAASREKSRSGPRWYSVVAFVVVAILLILNVQAIRSNTRAEERRADAAEAQLVIQQRMEHTMCMEHANDTATCSAYTG